MELSREYVYGSGHVDELLAQYTGFDRELAWWVIGDSFSGEGGGGSATALCSPAMPDGNGGVHDSIVAYQCVYDAHGMVVGATRHIAHPPLRLGFKGLFAERLDGGVSETMLGDDRPRLVPGATLIYHSRNRTLHAGLGRFLQSDPNATGLYVNESLACFGQSAMPWEPWCDLETLSADGTNLYQYAQGDPIAWGDPTGLFLSLPGMLQTGTSMWDMAANAMNGAAMANRMALGMGMMARIYGINQSIDFDLIMDWDMPDEALSFHALNAAETRSMILGSLDSARSSATSQVMANAPSVWDLVASADGTFRPDMDDHGIRSLVGKTHHGSHPHRRGIADAIIKLKNNHDVDWSSIRVNKALRDAKGNVIDRRRPDVQYRTKDGKIHVLEVHHSQSEQAARDKWKIRPPNVYPKHPLKAPTSVPQPNAPRHAPGRRSR